MFLARAREWSSEGRTRQYAMMAYMLARTRRSLRGKGLPQGLSRPTGEYVLNTVVNRVPLVAPRMRLYQMGGVQIADPETTTILTSAEMVAPRGISIGAGSIIGRYCLLDGRGGLTIGENVNISSYSIFISSGHEVDDPGFRGWVGPTRVGDWAWIGIRATVLGGLTIGEGAVVAAGAVVTRDVDPYTVVGGVPARFIKERVRDLDYALSYRPDWV